MENKKIRFGEADSDIIAENEKTLCEDAEFITGKGPDGGDRRTSAVRRQSLQPTFRFRKDLRLSLIACNRCDRRPLLDRVLFHGGYLYATDGFMAVRLQLREIADGITEDQVILLQGRMMSVVDFDRAARAAALLVEEDGLVVCKDEDGRFRRTKHYFEDYDGCTYPDVAERFTSALQEARDDSGLIHLDTGQLARIHKAVPRSRAAEIRMTEGTGTVIVRLEHYEDCLALLAHGRMSHDNDNEDF